MDTCPQCQADAIGVYYNQDGIQIKFCRTCGHVTSEMTTAHLYSVPTDAPHDYLTARKAQPLQTPDENGVIHLPIGFLQVGKIYGVLVEGSFFDDTLPTIPTNSEFTQDSND